MTCVQTRGRWTDRGNYRLAVDFDGHTQHKVHSTSFDEHTTQHTASISFDGTHRAQLRDTSQNPHGAWHTLDTGPHIPQALNLTFRIAFYALYKRLSVKVTSRFFSRSLQNFWTKIGNQFILLLPEDATFIIRTNINTRSCSQSKMWEISNKN